MRHLITIKLHDVVSWLVANIPTTVTSMLQNYTDGAKMIAAHPQEWLHDFDFVTNFKFHISYNMRLCLGPFLWNGLLAESSVWLFLGNDILNRAHGEPVVPIVAVLRTDTTRVEAQVVGIPSRVERRRPVEADRTAIDPTRTIAVA